MTNKNSIHFTFSARSDKSTVTVSIDKPNCPRVKGQETERYYVNCRYNFRNSQITDYCNAVLDTYAERIAKKSIKMQYSRTGNKIYCDISSNYQITKLIESKDERQLAKYTGNDFDDLISVAKLALYELVVFGIARDAASLWNLRNYAYQCLNRYYDDQKKQKKVSDKLELYTIEDDFVINDFYNIEEYSIIQNIVDILEKSLPKRMDKDLLIDIFLNCMVYGQSMSEYSRNKGIDSRIIRRHMERFKDLLKNKEIHDILSK